MNVVKHTSPHPFFCDTVAGVSTLSRIRANEKRIKSFLWDLYQSTNPIGNTCRHPENFHLKALQSFVASHENSWGSSYYQGVTKSLNRAFNKEV